MAVLGYITAIVLTAIYRGWALSVLWGWFIVPTFHLPQLRIPIALGVAVIVAMLTAQPRGKVAEHEFALSLVFGFLVTTIGLSLGWVYSLFV